MSAGAALAELVAKTRPSVQAQGPTRVDVGMSFFNLDGVAAWIAQDKHFFEKYGLSVTIFNFQGGAKAVAAMAAGDLPIALLGAADIINARSKGVPLQCVAGLINKFPFDFVVGQNITTPAQLKGAKGAISSFGGSSEFATRFALTRLGINPQEVTLLQVGDEGSRLAALSSGQIDFTVLTAGMALAAPAKSAAGEPAGAKMAPKMATKMAAKGGKHHAKHHARHRKGGTKHAAKKGGAKGAAKKM